ncbi:MAG: universal stress protein [Dehalococcoidia bacterium]
MYSKVLVPIDNSPFSNNAVGVGVDLASRLGSNLTGCHVYAARLHDARFRQMEAGLPDRYQEEDELRRQRQVHDSLITQGLQLISNSYLDVFEERCREAGVPCRRRLLEGTNYLELTQEVRTGGYDLVVMGKQGMGAVEGNPMGSVCERVVRKIRADVLVAKDGSPLGQNIAVAVDGSPQSLAALKAALALAKALDGRVEAIAAFDPEFHIVAFRSIAGVLSPEAAKVFRLREQEKLHDEIIHKGLEKIYRGHLDTAAGIARSEGVPITTTLLAGKPFHRILQHLEERRPSLLVVGRFGAHATGSLDMGNTAENLLRFSGCHILITSGEVSLQETTPARKAAGIPWAEEAEARLQNVPPFVRGMARQAIEEYALSHGFGEVTAEVMTEAREKMGM